MSQQSLPTQHAGSDSVAEPPGPSRRQLSVIDLSAAVSGSPEERARLRADLHRAAHGTGFFQLTGHGVTPRETDALMAAVRAFFALPEADRLAVSNIDSPHFRGYTRVGDEHTAGHRDWRDQLDIGAERPARIPASGDPAYWWLEGPNRWPAAQPDLRAVALGWLDRLSAVAGLLLHELLAAIGAPADFYDDIFAGAPHLHLKMVRYPGSAPGTAAGDGQGVGAHKDYGFLTLLLQDSVGGLQVQREDGLFHEVPPLPGAFVVNLGELLEVATDGYLKATNHRVVSPPGARERFSVPFFYNPRLDGRVTALPFPYADQAPGVSQDAANPLFAEYGRNALKGWLRAHPEAARRHHPDLLTT